MLYKPFHNQRSKPAFFELIKELIGFSVNDWQQQVLGTEVELSAFKDIVLQDGSFLLFTIASKVALSKSARQPSRFMLVETY